MVIQRLQSLLLFFAAVIMACVCTIVPMAYNGETPIYAYNLLPVVIICGVSAILLLIDIFLFKNLKLQMMVARITSWLLIASMFVVAFMLYYRLPADAYRAWLLPGGLVFVSALLTIWARARMAADLKLLKSYDRLR